VGLSGSFSLLIVALCFIAFLALAGVASASESQYGTVDAPTALDQASGTTAGDTTATGADTQTGGATVDGSGTSTTNSADIVGSNSGKDGSSGSSSATAAASIALVTPESSAENVLAGNDAERNTSTNAGAPTDSLVSDDKKYELHLTCNWGDPGIYWGSQADYLAGLLTIDYKLENTGTGDAINVRVTVATASNGATVASPLPDLGTVAAGAMTIFSLKWHVPEEVSTFTTQISICAECYVPPEDPKDIDTEDPKDIDLSHDTGQPTVSTAASTLLASNLPASSLPSTGFDVVSTALSLFLVTALLMAISVPARRLLRIRRK
jgi:hypothetical protein